MKIEDYATLDANGKIVYDEAKFTADLDRVRNSASETASANAEKKLRAQIEKEITAKVEADAKMSAEEKLAQEREAFEAERAAFNKERIVAMLKTDNLFTDDEVEILTLASTGDFEVDSANADKLISARKKRNADYEAQFAAKIQQGQPAPNGNGGSGGDSEAVVRAKAFNDAQAQETTIQLK